jgi:hypothetical protein
LAGFNRACREDGEAAMSVSEHSGSGVLELSGQRAHWGHLPKSVCLRSKPSAQNNPALQPVVGMYEFEVVTGNAAYREGERFYLTPAQAKRAYFSGRRLA